MVPVNTVGGHLYPALQVQIYVINWVEACSFGVGYGEGGCVQKASQSTIDPLLPSHLHSWQIVPCPDVNAIVDGELIASTISYWVTKNGEVIPPFRSLSQKKTGTSFQATIQLFTWILDCPLYHTETILSDNNQALTFLIYAPCFFYSFGQYPPFSPADKRDGPAVKTGGPDP